VDFYLGLARDAEGPVLELGCGTGRVTIPIAREGIAVTGLDIEPRMLELARRRSVGIGAVKWIEADMRRYTLPQRFGLIFVAYRGFLHLLEETDQRAALGCAFEHLLPGGRLALNLVNPVVLGLLNRPGASSISRVSGRPKQRYVLAVEMARLLSETGFEFESLHGGFDRSVFDERRSTEMIWVARRPVML